MWNQLFVSWKNDGSGNRSAGGKEPGAGARETRTLNKERAGCTKRGRPLADSGQEHWYRVQSLERNEQKHLQSQDVVALVESLASGTFARRLNDFIFVESDYDLGLKMFLFVALQ